MDALLQDLRYTIRTLAKAPGFTIAAVAALMLGIGANTAIFSVVNAVLLRPLPYPDPEHLLVFTNTSPQGAFPGASPTKFNVWRGVAAFHDVSAYRFNVVNVTGGDSPEQVAAGTVSADFFRLFGAPFVSGRGFTADEDRPNGGHVVVLGHGFWERRFGGDSSVVGQTLSIDGSPYEIVGILGAFDTDAIQSPDGPPDVWLPFQLDPETTMQGHFFAAAGRPRPGVTPGAIAAELGQAAAAFREKFPRALGPQAGFGTEPLQELVVANVRSSLWILAGAVGFVLLIACANVANLLLVRATSRQREMAIRAAIGAGRGQIVRQMLTESVLLAFAGGALGLGLGMVGIRALLAVNPRVVPRAGVGAAAVTIDWRVLAFTAAVSLLTGILFGLYPAWRAARTDLSSTLKESGGRGGGSRQNKARAVLVVAELALALVLLVGAALMIRTYAALRAVNPGFDSHQLLTMRMSLAGERFATTSSVAQLIRDGAERLAALPGVEVASAACCVPLQGGFGLPFTIVGRPLQDTPFHGGGSFTPISADYFSAFKIPVVRGRAFTERDDGAAPGVVVINQAMAKRYWPDGDPLVDRLQIAKGLGPLMEDRPRQIVGIVGDVRDIGLNRDPQPIMYIPWAQISDAQGSNLLEISPLAWVVRTRGEPQLLSKPIQDELRQASGGLPVARIRTMDEIVSLSTARSDFNMLLLATFAGAALLLAAIGVYGLMAYTVTQRTQEIGVRLALGADTGHVRNMVIGQGMRVALVGVAIGVTSAFGLTKVISALLFGVTARDPVVFVSVPIVLSAVALVGVWLPARRAARVDPMIALRAE